MVGNLLNYFYAWMWNQTVINVGEAEAPLHSKIILLAADIASV